MGVEFQAARLLGRHVFLGVITVIVLLGLLNMFGQRAKTSRADGQEAALQVTAPTRLRGGLLYEGRFAIVADRALRAPSLRLDRGWTEGMTINTIEPSPTGESSQGDELVFEFDPLEAGDRFVLWMQFQVDPTAPGIRPQDVELRDGDRLVASVDRTVVIFP